jgi:hypothetical protein
MAGCVTKLDPAILVDSDALQDLVWKQRTIHNINRSKSDVASVVRASRG